MELEDINAAVAAASAVAALASVAVARNQVRSARRTALEAIHVQRRGEQAQRLQDQWAALLHAADALVAAAKDCPDMGHDAAADLLRSRMDLLNAAHARVVTVGSADALQSAEALHLQCRRIAHYALRRRVVQTAIRALESSRCPGDAERCSDDAHNSASVALELLEGWEEVEDSDRPDQLEFLEYLLTQSGVLDREIGGLAPDDARRLLGLARHPVAWDRLVADWRWGGSPRAFRQAREDFVAHVRATLEASTRAAAPPNWAARLRSVLLRSRASSLIT